MDLELECQCDVEKAKVDLTCLTGFIKIHIRSQSSSPAKQIHRFLYATAYKVST